MSTRSLARHPLTGALLRPVGFRKDGRPIFPILGGSEPPNQPPNPPKRPDRPDGISEAEWSALGDPGKTALVRERQRATAAETALAAARATPPKPADPPKPPADGGQPDIAALIRDAVKQAVNPLLERDLQRETEAAAAAIRDSVVSAAGERFHDVTDALAQVDLTQLTDGNGRPDKPKIDAALDELLTRKPHLGKAIDPRRQTPPGTPLGGGGGTQGPLDDRVKATLARMQSSAGVKFAD